VRTACEQRLRDKPPNTAIEDAAVELPKLLKTEATILDTIESYRRRARELVADLRRIEASSYPRDYSRAKATAEVLALAERGQISASRLVERDGTLDFPTMQLSSQVYNTETRAIAFAHDVPDALAILAAIHTDAMIAAVCKAVDRESDDQNSLSHSEPETRAAEVMGDLRVVEFLENALVHAALAQGLPTEHRVGPDGCNVRAILQCRLVVVPPREGGSSPERASYDLIGGDEHNPSRGGCRQVTSQTRGTGIWAKPDILMSEQCFELAQRASRRISYSCTSPSASSRDARSSLACRRHEG